VIIAEKFSITLRAFPKELPTPFTYCSKSLRDLLVAFPTMSWRRFGFLYIALEAPCFYKLRLNIEDAAKKFQNQQWFFS
jgi:hypothetical protein